MKRKISIKEILISAVITYFITFVFDLLFFLDYREIVTVSPMLSIDRPGTKLDILFYYLLLTLLVVFIFIALNRKSKIKNKKYQFMFKSILLIVISVASIAIFSHFFPIARVKNVEEISGRVRKPDTYSYLFVRPTTSDQFWVQRPIPLVPDHNGVWRAGAHFGGMKGQRFEIVLLNSYVPLHPDKISGTGAYDLNRFAENTSKFVRLVVKR